MTSRRLLWAGGLLALGLAGCASHTPPRATFYPPSAPSTSPEQLSGTYCYFGPDLSVRVFHRGPDSIPFLNVQGLSWPSTIRVEARADRIVFTCTDDTGHEEQQIFVLSSLQATRSEEALVVAWDRLKRRSDAWIVPGLLIGLIFNQIELSGESRESRLFKTPDGQLVMSDSYRQSGYSQKNQSGQFWENELAVAVLFEPAAGDCAAAMAGRPLQPRFEKGLDLRLPACADRLEDELLSIMVQKGETEEIVWRLAHETVDFLVKEGGDWSRFVIETPSRITYKFDVGKYDEGCVLRLYGRYDRKKIFFPGSEGWYLAKRPLPECACAP